jgi:hypothetical protein
MCVSSKAFCAIVRCPSVKGLLAGGQVLVPAVPCFKSDPAKRFREQKILIARGFASDRLVIAIK